MTTWVLIVLVSIGGMRSEEANALTSVGGFTSREQCERAASAVKAALSPGSKEARAVCVEQGGPAHG